MQKLAFLNGFEFLRDLFCKQSETNASLVSESLLN